MNISIIGSTGSIGQSTLKVIARCPEKFKINFLVANSNYKLLALQAKQFNAKSLVITDANYLDMLKLELANLNINPKVYCENKELNGLIAESNQSIMIANNGIKALHYITEAIKSNNNIFLANKEALVCAGKIIKDSLLKSSSKIIPVDSEHNAIYQAIVNNPKPTNIRELILTSSGGPFYNYSAEDLEQVTIKDALNHPKWSMGAEISVNSATLVNKALEIIEAYYLFDIPKNNITAVYHPQSIVHGMVRYIDGSLFMIAGTPNMEIPISYALSTINNHRLNLSDLQIDIADLNNLTFESIKKSHNKAIEMAKHTLSIEGNAPCIFNSANEVAVNAFLKGKIKFTNIINVLDYTLNKAHYAVFHNLDDVYLQSDLAKKIASRYINSLY